MDAADFDDLARSLTDAASRRTLLGTALGGLFALGGLASIDARKKRKNKKKKKGGKGKGKHSPDTDAPQTLSCDGVVCAPGDRCLLGTCTCDEALCAAQDGCCSAGHCVAGDRLDACGNDGGDCRACLEKCEEKRCCLQHRAPCTLDRCCSGLVCKGLDHPVPACCHPDEAFCTEGDCCKNDCCGAKCCKDDEDCIDGACRGRCPSDQERCGDPVLGECCPIGRCFGGTCHRQTSCNEIDCAGVGEEGVCTTACGYPCCVGFADCAGQCEAAQSCLVTTC